MKKTLRALLAVIAFLIIAAAVQASSVPTAAQLRTNNTNILNASAFVTLGSGEVVTSASITLPDATVLPASFIIGGSLIFFGIPGTHGVVDGAFIVVNITTNQSSSSTPVSCASFVGGAGVLCREILAPAPCATFVK